MMFDLSLVSAWVTFLMSAFALIGVVRVFLSSGTRENAQSIEALRDSCEILSNRLQRVESELGHLPSAKEFNDLALAVTEVKGDIKGISKSFEATERSIRRMEDFLLKKGSQG